VSQHKIFAIRPEVTSEAVEALRPKKSQDEPVSTPPYELIEFEDEMTGMEMSVAVIKARGVLALNVDGWFGCCDLDELAEEIEEADADANVTAIIVEMDSPGGTVNGTPEAAERIARISKPLMVWTDGELCSAAYWITASADVIYATPSSVVGSVGCVLAFYDYSAMLDQSGIKVQVFRSGELKAAGYPGTALSEAEAAHFQSMVSEVGSDFAEWVTTYRDNVDVDVFDGRAVSGKQGVRLGLLDGVFVTREEAIKSFLEGINL
jgi:signal peptide peptidase SppA